MMKRWYVGSVVKECYLAIAINACTYTYVYIYIYMS